MKKREFLLYIVTNMVIFVPSPPFVAYGIILILCFNVVYLITISYSKYISALENKYRYPLLLLCAALVTLIFHMGLSFVSPVIGLTLGFIMYLIPLSVLTLNTPFYQNEENIKEQKNNNIKTLFLISFLSLLFFVIREFFSYGTISYPTTTGIATIHLPVQLFDGYSFIWSSIPGAFFLLTIFVVLLPLIVQKNKKEIEEVSE